MPYARNTELPDSVKVLPNDAQSVWRRVFNSALQRYGDEDTARRTAWTAVKNGWRKDGDSWVRKSDIAKVDEEQRCVYGWANVQLSVDGEAVIDTDNDVIDPNELERAVVDYVLKSRAGTDSHTRFGIGRLVASVVTTEEMQKAMGVEGLPIGWWVGFRVDDDTAWEKIKSGEYSSFSIGGIAHREAIADE